MIEFRKISEFPRGLLYRQLADAYSFNPECRTHWDADWQEYDEFILSDGRIADTCGFVTVLDGEAIGHITWDPRNQPASVTIGHNCILTAHKGHGYGRMQLAEAIRRIREYGVGKIIVTTNEIMLPAQRNYESVGFVRVGVRVNRETPFAGNYIDYEMKL